MARFFADVQAEREAVSPTGTDHLSDGTMRAHVRGWSKGVLVVCRADNGRDVIEVFETGGSYDPNKIEKIKTIYHTYNPGI